MKRLIIWVVEHFIGFMKKNVAAVEGERSSSSVSEYDLELGLLAALEETSDVHVVENEDVEISHESKRARIKVCKSTDGNGTDALSGIAASAESMYLFFDDPLQESSPSQRLQDRPLAQASCMLCTLPDPLLLRITCFLSPEDVLSFAATCRHAHDLASDDGIWRRLYYHRWPVPCETSVDDEQPNWKVSASKHEKQSLVFFILFVTSDIHTYMSTLLVRYLALLALSQPPFFNAISPGSVS